uniref:Uncharacterized protein n=1 Tax=Lactuca sativa TaxID=4236 RepID=A0A9R1XXA4_LACSA|nr:hypothetical protein LSAT_V11C200069020 [Lactuca sativa]
MFVPHIKIPSSATDWEYLCDMWCEPQYMPKEMKKKRNEHSLESMSDKLILEKVLGRSSVRLLGWGRDPVVAGNIAGSIEKSKCPSYDELVDELETMKGEHDAMKQILIQKNITYINPLQEKQPFTTCKTRRSLIYVTR